MPGSFLGGPYNDDEYTYIAYIYIYTCIYTYVYMFVILVSVFGDACLWELPHHYEESFGSNEMAGRIVKSSWGVM